MANKKKSGSKKSAKKKNNKETKSALMRGIESSKKQRAAAIKSKPKNPSAQQKREEQQRQGGLREYFRGVKTEIKKVVWPTRKELVSYTVVVIITCAVFALFLWGVDSGFLAIIREVFNISMN